MKTRVALVVLALALLTPVLYGGSKLEKSGNLHQVGYRNTPWFGRQWEGIADGSYKIWSRWSVDPPPFPLDEEQVAYGDNRCNYRDLRIPVDFSKKYFAKGHSWTFGDKYFKQEWFGRLASPLGVDFPDEGENKDDWSFEERKAEWKGTWVVPAGEVRKLMLRYRCTAGYQRTDVTIIRREYLLNGNYIDYPEASGTTRNATRGHFFPEDKWFNCKNCGAGQHHCPGAGKCGVCKDPCPCARATKSPALPVDVASKEGDGELVSPDVGVVR